MAESHVRPDIERERVADTAGDRVTVFIHNDDVTPYNYVILVLRTIFKLSHELAEHITWVAHNTGVARVVTRPRSEARRLVDRAQAAARVDGYPLTFSLEPEE